LSLQIRALEQELDAKLFTRDTKSVRLTPAGQALLPEARELLRAAKRAAEAARRAQSGEAGMLRAGFVNPAMDGFLSAAVRRFRKDRPGVELELREMSSTAQLAALRAGVIHCGFIRHGWLDCKGLAIRVVSRSRYVLAVPRDHALAGQARVPLAALEGLELILFPRAMQPRLHDAMMAAMTRAGACPRIVQEAASKHTALSLVAAGLGSALVPESARVWNREGVRFVDVEDGLPPVELAVALPRDAHPAALALAGHAAGQIFGA